MFKAVRTKTNSTYYLESESRSQRVGQDFILTAKDYLKEKVDSIEEVNTIDLVLLDSETFKTTDLMTRSDHLFRQVVHPFHGADQTPPLASKIGHHTLLVQTTQFSFFLDLKTRQLKDGFIHAIESDKSYLKHFKEDYLYCWKSEHNIFFIRYKITESGRQEFQAIANIYLHDLFKLKDFNSFRSINIVKKYDSNHLFVFFVGNSEHSGSYMIEIEPRALKVVEALKITWQR